MPELPVPDVAPGTRVHATGAGAPEHRVVSAAVRRWRLDLAYDGSGFRGFAAQAQPGLPTVAGALAGAIARAARTGEPPAIVCAGRTDAGVHATGQVVHVDLPEDYDADLKHALNRQLAPSIVVHVASPAAEGFDARRAATSRHYRYLVLAAPDPDPLLSGLAWHVPEPLDVRAMASATDPLLGEHDFRAFCRRAPGRAREEPIVRQVISATWRQVAGPFGDAASDAPCPAGPLGLLRFDIAAGSFCHQMVRSIVAVLVDAGRGRATAASVMELLASGSRAGAPRPAPAHGLCLTSVDYESVESTGRAAEGRAGTGGGLP